MIHMSPITSNLFLFLLLTGICVRIVVLSIAIALVGGSAWAGMASGHSQCAGTLLPSLSTAQPPHWSPSPIGDRLAKLFLVNCLLSRSHSRTACKLFSSSYSFRFKSLCSAICKVHGEISVGICWSSGSPKPDCCRHIFRQFCLYLLWCVSVPVW